jgi:hypothetical protein
VVCLSSSSQKVYPPPYRVNLLRSFLRSKLRDRVGEGERKSRDSPLLDSFKSQAHSALY